MATVYHLQHGAIELDDHAARNAAFELHHCFTELGGNFDSERIAVA